MAAPERRYHERDPQAAVRVGHFEQAMRNYDVEINQKMAVAVALYDKNYVMPLRKQVEFLSLPWWRRQVVTFVFHYENRFVPWLRIKTGAPVSVPEPVVPPEHVSEPLHAINPEGNGRIIIP